MVIRIKGVIDLKIQQIRNATMIITYANKKFLIDPFLADKGAYPGIPFSVIPDVANPMVDLPMSLEKIIDVDAVIVTHVHFGHFDEKAKEVLPKHLKMFVQSEKDANELRESGFNNVEVLSETGTMYEEIRLTKTIAVHGVEEITKPLFEAGNLDYEACGVIFYHSAEKVVYLAGDTIWCEVVKDNLETYQPEVVILNAGYAQGPLGNPIIMGKEDVYQVHQAAPEATLIATHLETVNHAPLTRKELSEFAKEKGMTESLLIPADGEIIML